jgi:hypothetical protein
VTPHLTALIKRMAAANPYWGANRNAFTRNYSNRTGISECTVSRLIPKYRKRPSHAPIRPMLVATTYAQACEIGAKADGRKLGQQTWAILSKIREVDTFSALIQGFDNWSGSSPRGLLLGVEW